MDLYLTVRGRGARVLSSVLGELGQIDFDERRLVAPLRTLHSALDFGRLSPPTTASTSINR
jgi:hypothetical protein